jgi:hypothetical protein
MKTCIGILLALVFSSGCQSALKTAYGIKKPRLENKVSIKKYLTKYKVNATDVYTFKDIQSFLKAGQEDLLSFPEAIFFNKDGNRVRYKKEAEACNAKVGDFLSDLENFSKMPQDSSMTMKQFFELLSDKPTVENADVNVVITWTKYVGRLNKTKAFKWIELIESAKAKGINVNYYLLNCDYQKSWNLPPQVIEKLGIKD